MVTEIGEAKVKVQPLSNYQRFPDTNRAILYY